MKRSQYYASMLLTATVVVCPLTLIGSAHAQDAVNLRMTIWSGNPAHLEIFNEIADDYKAEHPNVSVTFESLPFDAYTTTLTTQMAGGNPPDLAWIQEIAAVDFVGSGALAPLRAPFAEVEGYDLDDLVERAIALWTLEGELYAYPFSTQPAALFVNNDLIRAAGQRTPAELIAAGEWTWDNAMAIGMAVAASGSEGLVVRDFNFQLWQILAYIWDGWDAAPWSADTTVCTFDQPPMIEAITFIHDAIFETGAMPGPGESVDFFAGDAAMTITPISRASLLPQQDGFDWDVVPLPSGPAGEYAVVGQAGIGVFVNGPNREIATDFLAFFTNPQNSVKLAQFFPPARASLLNAETLAASNPLLSKEQLEAVVIGGIERGRPLPVRANIAQIQQVIRAELDALWLADADVPAVLASVCQRISPLLAR